MSHPTASQVSTTLLDWFDKHGRWFPWRSERDPLRVLVAEILLRKTGATTVARFLPSFLQRFGKADRLAAAGPELEESLQSIGLSRQRGWQLRALGRAIITQYEGRVPSSVSDLETLPGVGRYTSGMVAATCFGASVPAVDTNVARVICRVFGLAPSHFEARKSTNVWKQASALASAAGPRSAALTWALLDLGASICTARTPQCSICPLGDVCLYTRGPTCEHDR